MSKVLKTIVNVILFCAIVVAAGLLIPPFAGITTVMVDDVDMQTNLPQGSVAYAVEKDRSELKQGDKVLISQEGRQYVSAKKNYHQSFSGRCTKGRNRF